MDDWIWAILLLVFAAGIGFLELFIPSGGVLAVVAVLALLGSVVFAFLQGLVFGFVLLLIVVIGLPFLIWYMLEIWKATPIGRRILLDPAEDPALQPNEEWERHKTLLGKTGTAKSLMMPSGMIEIDGQRFDAVSAGMPIDPGTPVRIVQVDGINLTVRPADQSSKSMTPPASTTDHSDQDHEIENPFA
ncbi:MAG: NfeD family protein [Planctomycetaceae bacterium]|nr:NfeD family protein [Planctomycetaceae bacterium]